MRYTRNRQQAKVSGKLFYLAVKSQEISKWNKHEKSLDPTFKWYRDFVWEIEKYWESYITIGTYGQDDFKVIPIK